MRNTFVFDQSVVSPQHFATNVANDIVFRIVIMHVIVKPLFGRISKRDTLYLKKITTTEDNQKRIINVLLL